MGRDEYGWVERRFFVNMLFDIFNEGSIVNGYVFGLIYIFMGCVDEEGFDGRGRYINGMELEIIFS